MKALALTLALAVAAAGTHADSHAQDGKSPSDLTVLIPSKTWSAAAVPRSPSEVADAWSGAIDGIAWWVNLYGEQAVRKQIDVLLRESVADARKLIEWTGDGALVEVRLIERSHPTAPSRPWASWATGCGWPVPAPVPRTRSTTTGRARACGPACPTAGRCTRWARPISGSNWRATNR